MLGNPIQGGLPARETSTQETVFDSDQERVHDAVEQVQAKSNLITQMYTRKEGVWACSRGEQHRAWGSVWISYSWSLSKERHFHQNRCDFSQNRGNFGGKGLCLLCVLIWSALERLMASRCVIFNILMNI